jgi:hypothetical protein
LREFKFLAKAQRRKGKDKRIEWWALASLAEAGAIGFFAAVLLG